MDVEKSQRAFVGVTLIAVLALAAVLLVYAAILGSLQGGEVTVGGVTGNIGYKLTNATGVWSQTLEVTGTGVSWYSRMNTTGNEYVGPIKVTWQLQKWDGSWANEGATTITNTSLTAAPKTIYASTDGDISTNRDWSLTATAKASYRVIVTIESTGS